MESLRLNIGYKDKMVNNKSASIAPVKRIPVPLRSFTSIRFCAKPAKEEGCELNELSVNSLDNPAFSAFELTIEMGTILDS